MADEIRDGYNRRNQVQIDLSEYEAKDEFSYALTAAEKYYERKSTKASIPSLSAILAIFSALVLVCPNKDNSITL